MDKNEEIGLPFGKMQKLRVAFDIDGTLRCNCTPTCNDPNGRWHAVLRAFAKQTKNLEVYVWSGGGAQYALGYVREFNLPIKESRCISKVGAPQMDIAFDDIQDTAIADKNIIVREK